LPKLISALGLASLIATSSATTSSCATVSLAKNTIFTVGLPQVYSSVTNANTPMVIPLQDGGCLLVGTTMDISHGVRQINFGGARRYFALWTGGRQLCYNLAVQ
jgi:hypothetical protein